MSRTRTSTMLIAGISMILTGAVYAADMPDGKYLDGKGAKVGVILAHGQGADPDSLVVGSLRKAINRELGFHTLSLQMPIVSGRKTMEQAYQYASTFPEAYARIQKAVDFLKNEKGVTRVYLMGYSMGGRMTCAFLANHPDSGVAGFIAVGLLGGGEEPINGNATIRRVKIPVLDLYADSGRDAKAADFRKRFVSQRYKQVPIPGARHEYEGHESEVNAAAVAWLKEQTAGQ